MSFSISGSKPAGSKLRLQRKGSDSAVKKHSIQATPSSIAAPSKTIESGTSSLPRNLSKGILSGGGSGLVAHGSHHKGSGSGLVAPSNNHKRTMTSESRNSELESSTSSAASSASHEGEEPTRKKVSSGESGLRKFGGLRKPSNFSAGGSYATNSPSNSPSLVRKKEESEIPVKEHPTTSRALFSGSPSQKNKLQRLAAPSMISSGVVHTNKEKEVVSQPTNNSHSSLDSCEESREVIKITQTTKPVLSGPTVDVEAKSVLGSETSELHPPPSLTISEEHKEQDVVSPPERFKSIGDIESGSGHGRYGRRISPEGMSHEDAATLKENETIAEPAKEKDGPVETTSKGEESSSSLTHGEECRDVVCGSYSVFTGVNDSVCSIDSVSCLIQSPILQ